jgi:hypothetical protein
LANFSRNLELVLKAPQTVSRKKPFLLPPLNLLDFISTKKLKPLKKKKKEEKPKPL